MEIPNHRHDMRAEEAVCNPAVAEKVMDDQSGAGENAATLPGPGPLRPICTRGMGFPLEGSGDPIPDGVISCAGYDITGGAASQIRYEEVVCFRRCKSVERALPERRA
jgi:hypothetical protein